MLEKKLITLACAAGILACGACFLPPLPEPKPKAPPILLDLHGIARIRVDVTNQSAQRHLDPLVLAKSVASEINLQGKRAHVTAFANDGLGDEDGVLKLIVLSESATLEQQLADGNSAEWRFEVISSAVLTTKSGQVVWRETDGGYWFSQSLRQESEAEVWKDPALLYFLATSVGNKLVNRMLNAR